MVRFTAVNIVLGVACILGYLALCKFIFRPDVSKLKTKVDYLAQYRGEKLTHESRVGLIFLVAFIAAMFAPSFIDADGTVGALLNNLGAPGALILLLGIMAAVCRKGKTWFDFAKAAGNINWNIIVLFIVIMPLSAALGSDSVNIVPAVVGLLEPLVSNMSTLVFEVAVILFIGGLTIFAPDIILAATLPPILYGFCVRLNVSTELVITLLTFTISAALATPSSSTMSAIIFANTEWIDIKSAYKYCITASILNCLIIIVLGLTVALPFLEHESGRSRLDSRPQAWHRAVFWKLQPNTRRTCTFRGAVPAET